MQYLTDVYVPWRPVDYDVRNIVKGMKKESFRGYSQFRIHGKSVIYTENNVEEVMPLLLSRVGEDMAKQIDEEVDVVPIPGSEMAVGAPGSFRIVDLATKFVSGYGAKANLVSAIRWDAPRKKAHQSHDLRSPDLFQPHMRLAEKPTRSVLLFDDVMTSGSQMVAAARFLRENGYELAAGCVVARATKTQHDKMIEWTTEDLPIKRETVDF
jgi:hypothetical protein